MACFYGIIILISGTRKLVSKIIYIYSYTTILIELYSSEFPAHFSTFLLDLLSILQHTLISIESTDSSHHTAHPLGTLHQCYHLFSGHSSSGSDQQHSHPTCITYAPGTGWNISSSHSSAGKTPHAQFSTPTSTPMLFMLLVPSVPLWVPTPLQLTHISRIIHPYWCERQPDKTLIEPSELYTVFKQLVESDLLLGLLDVYVHPKWTFLTVLPVPPPPVQPSIAVDGGVTRSEDNLTGRYYQGICQCLEVQDGECTSACDYRV